MAILTRREAAELPQTRFVAKCNRCDEDGLVWDVTRNGKPWLFGLMFADSNSKPENVIEVVQRLTEDGSTAGPNDEVVETVTHKVEVLRQAAHICPMAGPGTELFPSTPNEDEEEQGTLA